MENRRCCLRHTYLSVKTQEGRSYGGSQTWSESRLMRKYGCGVAAMGDVLVYLGIHQISCNTDLLYGIVREDGLLSYPRYERYLRKIRHRYLGIIPGLGVLNFGLCRALNKYFRHYRIELRARWCLSSRKMLGRIQNSLSRDYPVILAIGQNIPFWRRKKLTLYRQENGNYFPATETKAHYVTVTGMENGYLQIASWGKEYFISWEEYLEYARKYSSFLVSNICLIQEKKRKLHE
ncbi:hypothetical protein H8S44_08345 [Anaerosacchariphilus sp. NSJ-68]|uniref:Uncharacterized protein n=2 Tax=Lachnospiraceae TaxID=186803 RepID=A0A923LC23_9FIRM|nr:MULTISPECIES: hypothetical protein [Lachnospiraceae]MBC5659778.1 hypothetical protein [Anaerosacchariphilus hominis]MBC5697444.1 hypothetical protein [Roseburia difficilis]